MDYVPFKLKEAVIPSPRMMYSPEGQLERLTWKLHQSVTLQEKPIAHRFDWKEEVFLSTQLQIPQKFEEHYCLISHAGVLSDHQKRWIIEMHLRPPEHNFGKVWPLTQSFFV